MTIEEQIMKLQTYKMFEGEDTVYVERDDVLKLLEQEPKTGHWEWVQYDSNPNIGNLHCSECRNIVMECAKKNEKGGILIYKYCPNCGARMAESEVQE